MSPTETVINNAWWAACALACLCMAGVFYLLARSIKTQYVVARTPMTNLAAALVRQKLAIAVMGLAFFAVFGTIAGISLWMWEVNYWLRMVYRAVALVAIVGVVVEGYLVKRAMDKDVRNVLREAREVARRQMLATERIAAQGDALADAGVADRSATATERIADAGESWGGKEGDAHPSRG